MTRMSYRSTLPIREQLVRGTNRQTAQLAGTLEVMRLGARLFAGVLLKY